MNIHVKHDNSKSDESIHFKDKENRDMQWEILLFFV